MCKVYRQIGSLTYVLSNLEQKNIHDFKSLKEIMEFQYNYANTKKAIFERHERLISEEESRLQEELHVLEKCLEKERKDIEGKLIQEIEKIENELNHILSIQSYNILTHLYKYIKVYFFKKRINLLKLQVDFKILDGVKHYQTTYDAKSLRFHSIKSSLNEVINNSSSKELSDLERKKHALEEINSCIYGAKGEELVEIELNRLPDNCILINDFYLQLDKPIYNSNENDLIKSIQIDHILITPGGLFLIETKNWNQQSLNNLELRSPVQQIKRASYVIFNLINNRNNRSRIRLNNHHWGLKKIPIKSLIIMTNAVPSGEFEYVKILPLNQLVSYVKYFKPIFNDDETKEIADYLLSYL